MFQILNRSKLLLIFSLVQNFPILQALLQKPAPVHQQPAAGHSGRIPVFFGAGAGAHSALPVPAGSGGRGLHRAEVLCNL